MHAHRLHRLHPGKAWARTPWPIDRQDTWPARTRLSTRAHLPVSSLSQPAKYRPPKSHSCWMAGRCSSLRVCIPLAAASFCKARSTSEMWISSAPQGRQASSPPQAPSASRALCIPASVRQVVLDPLVEYVCAHLTLDELEGAGAHHLLPVQLCLRHPSGLCSRSPGRYWQKSSPRTRAPPV